MTTNQDPKAKIESAPVSSDSGGDTSVAAMEEGLAALRRVLPQTRGALVVQDVESAIAKLESALSAMKPAPQPVQSVDAADEAKLEVLLDAYHRVAGWLNRYPTATNFIEEEKVIREALRSFFKASRSAQAAQGVVSVPREDLIALVNAPRGIEYNNTTDFDECFSCGAIDKASRCNHTESCSYAAHLKVVARVLKIIAATEKP